MTDYEQLIDIFINVTKGEPIAQIGSPFLFYYSDDLDKDILIKDIFSIDIKSAFPTICKILFGEESEFVKKIYSYEEKLKRNIFISTTLKNWSQTTNIDYLSEITLLSKILIFNYVFSKYSNIKILEYAKDGMYIHGIPNTNYNEYHEKFFEIMKKYNIVYHEDKIDTYIRFNKTSIYQSKANIEIKGKYKDLPSGLYDIVVKLLSGLIYNNELISLIQKVYSKDYFNILFYGSVVDYLEYLYKFKNNKFININGDFIESINEVNPYSYLYNIIYPILNLIRLEQSNSN